MRICVLGGTRFIGRAIVDALADHHEVLVVHRGRTEPDGLPDLAHLHADRMALTEPEPAKALADFDPEAVIDCMAIGAADAEAVLDAFPGDDRRLVVLSSMDTYRAYGSLHAGTVTDAVPLDETSPVRPEKYPYRGQVPGMDDYDKLDVEPRWLERGGVVARLPMVTGPRDYQRRQDFILRRVRHERQRIPIGSGNALLTHGDVDDVARGVRLLVEADATAVAGEIFNFGEERTPSLRLRAEAILRHAGHDAELVTVPDGVLPPDLGITAAIGQHLLVSSAKARSVLGWTTADPEETFARTVAWHLDHPPSAATSADGPDDGDFAGDDAALAASDDAA